LKAAKLAVEINDAGAKNREKALEKLMDINDALSNSLDRLAELEKAVMLIPDEHKNIFDEKGEKERAELEFILRLLRENDKKTTGSE
jgi:hypothetical protein